MGFGSNLSNLRTTAKLSQDDVAGALNMTRPAYKQLETEERTPSNTELKAISELFGVRTETLMGSDPLIDQALGEEKVASGVDKLKYKNLILYLAQEVGARPNVGETVFYKLVYFVETLARIKKHDGSGIVNEQFYKMQYGPVPASFQTITEEMIGNNELDMVQGRYFTYMQTKYLPRVAATGLTTYEREIIDTVIERLGDKSATELSDLSHKDQPWIEADDKSIVNLDLVSKTDASYLSEMGRA